MDTEPRDNIQLRVMGECRMCGDCCRPPIMTHESMLDESRGCCKHLWHNLCLIRLAFETGTPPFFATDADLVYWAENCKPYPMMIEREDGERALKFVEEHWPEKCGYRVLVTTDGDGT